MKSKKVRRHSGWITPQLHDKSMKFSEMIDDGLEPQISYDNWLNYRDGFRDISYLEWKKRNKEKFIHRKFPKLMKGLKTDYQKVSEEINRKEEQKMLLNKIRNLRKEDPKKK